ncbi:MAG: hypothetical protein M1820_004516 [Bogoriella megaspora]|nr:MAG: hypothetical protein M1820_004516 [Bogoriella megaspora]
MPWRPLPRLAFAICIFPFQASDPADLPLEIGDELYIIERGGSNGDWYRGYLVAPPSLLAGLTSSKGQALEARVFSGIFPKNCVEIRELLGEANVHGKIERQDAAAQHSPPGTSSNSKLAASSTHARRDVSTPEERTALGGVQTPPKSEQALSRSLSRRSISRRLSKRHARDLSTQGYQGRISPSQLQSQLGFPVSPVSLEPRAPGAPKPQAPVPMLKIGDETPTSESEPLVDEIASCLREWHSSNVHELLLGRKYKQLEKMAAVVVKLDTARKQLLHNVLTAQELRKVRERTVWDLVNGNKTLSGEVIVRSPSERGRILTAEDSAIEITKLQSMMSLLSEPPVAQIDKNLLHHLLMNVKSVTGSVNQLATVSVFLCIKQQGDLARPLSEAHAVDVPSREMSAVAISDDRMRTLFTDLSAVDIGEGAGSGNQLYLVFKVLTTEPYRSSSANDAWIPSHSHNASASGSSLSTPVSGSLKRGRSSFMWGQKPKRETAQADKIQERKSATSPRQPTPDGSNPPKNGQISDGPKTVKRVIGLGVVQIDELMRESREADYQVNIFSPRLPYEDKEPEGRGWNDVIKELHPSPSESFKRCSLVTKLQVHMKAFADPDADELIKATPTLLQAIRQTRRIGFSGAPTKQRSDIYITLAEPLLAKNSFLSHPKAGITPLVSPTALANLQLTLEVRRQNGERIENCIYPTCNSAGHTAWRTNAIERGESWNTTIRLAISPEDVPGCHLIMSISDGPEFPFALCWMPLWVSEAFVRDGDHSLVLYKYDEYTSSMIAGRGAYLALPWSSKKKDEEVTGSIASLKLRTYLCSTKYSQDPTLLGLLKWKSQTLGELIEILQRFVFVPELEIVKLLSEVFDALFQVLTKYSGTGENEDLVFNALIRVLSIVHDRRFNLQPLVDKYAEESFDWPFATSCLIRSFNRLLADPTDPDTSRKLRATLKVGGHVLKFIVNARHQQKEKEAGIGITGRQPVFAKDIRLIFKGLNDLMKNQAPILIGTKTLAVQNLHVWLPELSAHMETKDILQLAIDFVDSCGDASGKIVLYKLVLIVHLVQLDLFKVPKVRRQLTKQTVSWLTPYWGKTKEVNEQWKEQVRLCCSVVSAQLSGLGEEACEFIPKLVDSYIAIQATPREEKASLSLLFPTSYPFQNRQAPAPVRFDEAMVEISAVLAAIFTLPISIPLDLPGVDLSEFLLEALQAYKSVLDCDAFPRSWLSVHVYHHKSAIRTLERIAGTLMESFLPHPDDADNFSTEIWRAFFDTLIDLIGSDALALETFPEQKRRAVWKIAGDVREHGADLLRRSWEAIGWDASDDEKKQFGVEKIGGYQVQYVPALVAPIIQLCMSVHQGLRSVAVGILRTMIISEWTLNEDLGLLQAEMIDCLDKMFKSKNLTESILQKLFINELIDSFELLAESPDDPLFVAVKRLIGIIDELLDLLVAVHGGEAEGEAFHIMDRLHLMEFLKDMQKDDIYIRYIHQLASLQSESKNHTEAGLALRLHSELYEWDPTLMLEPLDDPPFPAQTAFERKEQLYFQQVRQFEEGSSWENALGTYRELIAQYEHNIFDFHKLARAQRAMATAHDRIASGDRQHPRYFRVVYKGLGFPTSLRDKEFIFEGSPTDRLASFTDKMQQHHPAAQILSAGKDEELEGQFLQIYPVSPQKKLDHPVFQRQKVSQPIREHFLLSRPKQFVTTSRRQLGNDVNITDVTVEKTLYTTAESFPTILRRSEIIQTENITLDPLQAAIERTTRKTQELLILEKRASENSSSLVTLTDAIHSSVDPNAELSVSHYRSLLPQSKSPNSDAGDADEEEEPEPPPFTLLENALRVALLDHALTIKRSLNLYSQPGQEAAKAELNQRFENTFHPELLALVPVSQYNAQSSGFRDYALSPQPSLSGSIAATPRAQSPNTQAGASVPLPPHSNGSLKDRRQSKHESKRRSLAFLRKGISSTDEGQTNGIHSPSKARDPSIHGSASVGEESNPGSPGAFSVKGVGKRLSFLRTNNGTEETSTGAAKAEVSSSQSLQSTETPRDRHDRGSDRSSEHRRGSESQSRSGRATGRRRQGSHVSSEPPMTASGRSASQSLERSQSRDGSVGESVKKRFSVLGLGRKGSRGNVKRGKGVREVLKEE